MNKNILIAGLLILLPVWAGAQDFVDAYRYSSTKIEGTARSGGMGNAFGALGGDFTGVGINPAGLGLYRSTEFVLTPNFGMIDSKSTYLNSKYGDNKYKLGFSNLSYVGTVKSGGASESGLISINFGIGFNKLKDFNSNMLAEGQKSNASFMDYIAENANWNDWSDFYEELAWNTDMLQYDSQAKEYWHDIRDAGYGQSQRKTINRSGSIDEYTLGVGMNFSHKFYLGASVGIADLYFKEETNLREWDAQNNIPFFDEYNFSTSLRTVGTGYNLKLGMIYKPVNSVRLGLALHTPTFYSLHDNFETAMSSKITYEDKTTKTYDASSPLMEYDYDMETPFRAVLSGAVVIGKKGLVSADYEYVNFAQAKLRNGGDGETFVDQNNETEQIFKATGNIRLGGEYRLTEAFSLRGGYEFYPTAYNSEAFNAKQPNSDYNYNIMAAGFGYRSGGFFFDLAYRHSIASEENTLYPAPITNAYPAPKMAKFDNTVDKVLFTLGFRF